VQALVKEYLHEIAVRRPTADASTARSAATAVDVDGGSGDGEAGRQDESGDANVDVAALIRDDKSYIDVERAETTDRLPEDGVEDKDKGRLVDVRLFPT
jgi:hypothetical protein